MSSDSEEEEEADLPGLPVPSKQKAYVPRQKSPLRVMTRYNAPQPPPEFLKPASPTPSQGSSKSPSRLKNALQNVFGRRSSQPQLLTTQQQRGPSVPDKLELPPELADMVGHVGDKNKGAAVLSRGNSGRFSLGQLRNKLRSSSNSSRQSTKKQLQKQKVLAQQKKKAGKKQFDVSDLSASDDSGSEEEEEEDDDDQSSFDEQAILERLRQAAVKPKQGKSSAATASITSAQRAEFMTPTESQAGNPNGQAPLPAAPLTARTYIFLFSPFAPSPSNICFLKGCERMPRTSWRK